MSDLDIGYLQHGDKATCMRTESVSVKHLYADNYQVFYEGKWRKVHIQVNRLYIVYRGNKITLTYHGL